MGSPNVCFINQILQGLLECSHFILKLLGPVVLNPCLTWVFPFISPARSQRMPGPMKVSLSVLGRYSHQRWVGNHCSHLFSKEKEDESWVLCRVLACFLLKQRSKAEGNGMRSWAVLGSGNGPTDPPGGGLHLSAWRAMSV